MTGITNEGLVLACSAIEMCIRDSQKQDLYTGNFLLHRMEPGKNQAGMPGRSYGKSNTGSRERLFSFRSFS